MSLRYKIVIIVVSVAILLFVSLSLFSYFLSLSFTRDIEERVALENLWKVKSSIENELYEFSELTTGFAQWTPTYDFIETGSYSFIESSLNQSDFEIYKISFAAILDLENNIVFSSFNGSDNIFLSQSLLPKLLEEECIKKSFKNFTETSGFYIFEGRSFLISVQPVYDTSKSLPANGYVIVLRDFTDLRIFNIGDYSQKLYYEPFALNNASAQDKKIRADLLCSSIISRMDRSSKEVKSYSLLNDISNKPAIILKYVYRPDIPGMGIKASTVFVIVSAILIIIFTSIIIILLEKIIISRVVKLNEKVGLISENKPFNFNYLPDKNIFKPNDEIENLNLNIFKMLSTVGYRYNLEKLVLNIASDFINLDKDKYDDFIQKSLALVGSFTGSDRAFVITFTKDGKEFNTIFEWTSEGIEPAIDFLKNIPVDSVLFAFNSLKNNGIFFINSTTDLPDEAEGVKKLYEKINIKSTLGTSIFYENKIIGLIGLGTVIDEKKWKEEDIEFLKNISNIFTSLIVKYIEV